MNKIESYKLGSPFKEEYISKYYTYITKISSPIIEELEKRHLHFKYSKDTNSLSIEEMAFELKSFCELNGINKDERHDIVFNILGTCSTKSKSMNSN